MVTTVRETDRKPEATTGNHSSQRHLALTAEAPPPCAIGTLSPTLIRTTSFSGVLGYAAQASGHTDEELARELHICNGYMSRFLRGVAEAWAKRIVRFMKATHNVAPLQWLAAQVGCEVVVLDARAAEIAELQARINKLQHSHAA